MKWKLVVLVVLVVLSTAGDMRDTPSPETWRVIFDLVFFAALWATVFFVGMIAFRVLRKVWGWSEKL